MTLLAHSAAPAISYALWQKWKGKPYFRRELSLFAVLGILPDVPLLFLVVTGLYNPSHHFHHTWVTHTPFFWGLVSLCLFFFFPSFSLKLLFATWLHLAMDWYGGGDGIMFLYPFSHHQYGVLLSGVHGTKGLKIYLSHWYFLILEVFLILAFLFCFSKGETS